MPVAARSPRQARRLATLAGLALIVCGVVLWLVGDDTKVSAENRADMHSSAAWNGVIDGYESTETGEYEAARADAATGDSQMTWGIVLIIGGAVVAGSRWIIQPANKT